MARRQTTIVRCDRNGCNRLAEILDPNEAPPGWLIVYTEKNYKYVSRNEAHEFCSEKCVSRWALDRDKYLRESTNGNGNHENKTAEKVVQNPSVLKHQETRELVLEALSIEPENFYSATEIAGVVGINRGTALLTLNELSKENKVEFREQLSSRGKQMRVYKKGGDAS